MKSKDQLVLSLLVEVEYRLVNYSMQLLIFIFKFQLLGKSTSTLKEKGATKHQANDTNTCLAKFKSNFYFYLWIEIKNYYHQSNWKGTGGWLIRPCDQYYCQILSYGQIYTLKEVNWYH